MTVFYADFIQPKKKQLIKSINKAIDEVEEECSQHNAKKLVDTSVKPLRDSIPKNIPYFHIEFGPDKSFLHVIDDKNQFKTSIGLNILRDMLEWLEKDIYSCLIFHIN